MTPELLRLFSILAAGILVVAVVVFWWTSRAPDAQHDDAPLPLFGSGAGSGSADERGPVERGARSSVGGGATSVRATYAVPPRRRTPPVGTPAVGTPPVGAARVRTPVRGVTPVSRESVAGTDPRPEGMMPVGTAPVDVAPAEGGGEDAAPFAVAAVEAPVPEAQVPEATLPAAPVPEAPVPEATLPAAPVVAAPVVETPVVEAPVVADDAQMVLGLGADRARSRPVIREFTTVIPKASIAHTVTPVRSSVAIMPLTPAQGSAAVPDASPPVNTATPVINAAGVPGTMVEGHGLRFGVPAEGTLQFLPGRLEIRSGLDAGREIRFVNAPGPDGTTVTFGRSDGELYRHVQLREKTVSRQHARLHFRIGRWYLVNLSQTNPVAWNGTELANAQEQPLADGDRIEMGEVAFTFRTR